MLRLTLIRHAKTEPGHSGKEDWERVLEARGEHDAHEMGQRLKQRRFKPDTILSSPAARAIRTAQIIAKELGFAAHKIEQVEQLYLSEQKDLLKAVRHAGGEAQHVMVFGHNPGLTDFASKLSTDRTIDNLPTCAVYSLEFDLERWNELEWASGVNVEFDYPKNG